MKRRFGMAPSVYLTALACYLMTALVGVMRTLPARVQIQEIQAESKDPLWAAPGQRSRVASTSDYDGRSAFSPDGATIALGGPDGRAYLWNWETGERRSFALSPGASRGFVDHIAYSHDGRRLAATTYDAASYDTAVTVWSLAEGIEPIQITILHPHSVIDLKFDVDDKKLVAGVITDGYYYSASVWDATSGKKLQERALEPQQRLGAMTSDGRYAFLTRPGEGAVYELMTGRKAFDPPLSGRYCFSEDDTVLAVYVKNQIVLQEVPSGAVLNRVDIQTGSSRIGEYTGEIALSADKSTLAVAGLEEANIVALIDLTSGKVVDGVEACPPVMLLEHVRFSPKGRILVTNTSRISKGDREVQPLLKVWRLPEEW